MSEQVGTSITEATARIVEKARQLQESAETETAETSPAPVEAKEQAHDVPEQAPAEDGGASLEPESRDPDESDELEPLPEHLTVEDLVNDYGLDKKSVLNKFRATVELDGESREVPLHELVGSFRRLKEHQAASEAFERQKQQFEAESAQKAEILDNAVNQLQATANVVETMYQQEEAAIHAQFQHVDWQRLRAENPGEFSARQTEYQQALLGTQQRKQHAWNELESANKRLIEAQQQRQNEHLEQAQKQLRTLIPEWNDAEVAQKEGSEVAAYLKAQYNATDKEIGDIVDPRVIAMARDAMRYRRSLEKLEQAKQHQPAEPAAARGGAKATPKVARHRRRKKVISDAEKRLKETGRQEDAVSVLTARRQRI